MSFRVCGDQSKKPQAPKATAEKRARRARLRAKQARVSRVRFTGVCLCLFVLCFRYGSKQRGPAGPDCLPSA